MAVRAIPLQSDPVGAEIALLEHVDRDAPGAGEVQRDPMIGTAITKDDEIGDAALVQECVEEAPPVRRNWPR